jgi:polar amino acid transport system substrate-binding protein
MRKRLWWDSISGENSLTGGLKIMTGSRRNSMTDRRTLLQRGTIASGLALAAGGMVPGVARAQESGASRLQEVLNRGQVIVGTGAGNPPWHFEDENGDLQGFDIEMARLLAKGLFEDPDAVEFEIQASDARVPNLQADRVDVVFQFMTVNAGRAQLAEFSIPYYRESVTLLFPSDSQYTSAAEMVDQGSRIAILQNPYAEDLVHVAVPDAQVEQFDSVANTILAMDSGRVDAAAIDLSTAQWKVAQDPDRYRVATDSWSPQTYAAAVKPGDQVWLNFVNSVLHEGMTGVEFDTYRDAFLRYFGEELPAPQSGFPLEFR